jgi:hypothetical protein
MTPFKLFVSVFFISLGIFFLLDLNPYYYHPFSLNLKLLPLLLVFIGILLLKPKKIITMITVSLMAILLSSCIFSTYKYWCTKDGNSATSSKNMKRSRTIFDKSLTFIF